MCAVCVCENVNNRLWWIFSDRYFRQALNDTNKVEERLVAVERDYGDAGDFLRVAYDDIDRRRRRGRWFLKYSVGICDQRADMPSYKDLHARQENPTAAAAAKKGAAGAAVVAVAIAGKDRDSNEKQRIRSEASQR